MTTPAQHSHLMLRTANKEERRYYAAMRAGKLMLAHEAAAEASRAYRALGGGWHDFANVWGGRATEAHRASLRA
jgi:hypothetical protein